MEKWEIALHKFLMKWKKRKEVIGAIVCGSYITGDPSEHSDIDLHILLDSKTRWRERGNKIIDGFLIEYFANPIKKHYQYFEEDFKKRTKTNAHMFFTGKILFDKTGELKKLVSDAKKYFFKRYPKQNKIEIELSKYRLWDNLDNLEEVFESNNDEFFFVFYNYLKELFDIYAKFLRFDCVPVHKLKSFLSDERAKKKYCVKDFPDKNFLKMYIKAIKIEDKHKMMKLYKKIIKHVFNKMNGFNIDGWKIKSPA